MTEAAQPNPAPGRKPGQTGKLFACLGIFLLVTALMIVQHALVRSSDLRHIDVAFFNVNSIVGVLLMAFTLADRFWIR